jgi:hypothetical protein
MSPEFPETAEVTENVAACNKYVNNGNLKVC